MSGPDFDQYFERDFLSGEDYLELYGTTPEVFTIAAFDMRDSYDEATKSKMPKPVVYLAELKKPVFLNGTSHDNLLERFGKGYSKNPKVIGQLVTLVGERKVAKKGPPVEYYHIIWFTPTPHPDMHKPIGVQTAERWLARLREFGGSPDGFLRWVQPHSHALHDLLKGLAPQDYPFGALARMGQYIDASLKVAPRDPTTGRVEPPKQPAPAVKQAAPITPKPPEKPVEITEDDIPF